MRKSCKYCGRMHPIGALCTKKPQRMHKATYSRADRSAAEFRSSHAWKCKREEIRKRDRYLCCACMSCGVYSYDGIEVHHIVSLQEDYNKRLDGDNLITLCRMHHKAADSGKLSKSTLRGLIKVCQRGDKSDNEG